MKSSGMGIRRKMVLVMVPVIIICYLITFFIINTVSSRIVKESAENSMSELAEATSFEIASVVSHIRGIMENVKVSIEGSCENADDVKRYIYGIADAYLDIIPTGIYCGLTDGTYIDKLWVPDDDWVMQERPWYIEGLVSDEVTLGEAYMDAQTEEYIVSLYSNIKDRNGNVMGVVCADVTLSEINDILTDKKLYDNGYVYAVDTVSKMVFSNNNNDKQNGQILSDLDDYVSLKVNDIISEEEYDEFSITDGKYILVKSVPKSHFVIVCVAPEEDVLSAVSAIRLPMIVASIIGCALISIIMVIVLNHFLKPVGQIMRVMDSMAKMDLTKRTSSKSGDEFGSISDKINTVGDKLRSVVLGIEDAIGAVENKAETNESAASRLGSLAKKQSVSVEELENVLEKMDQNMTLLCEETNLLSDEISSTNDKAYEMTKQLELTTGHLTNGEDKMRKMTDTMSDISQISEELQDAVNNMHIGLDGIKKMVDEINAVAAQTNLLSLNASIEAARAGEAGKGFAVVADEIRTLADQTAQSAVNIVDTTSELEMLVGDVTRAASGSIERIKSGTLIVGSTNDMFTELKESMFNMQSVIANVSNSLKSVHDISDEMQKHTAEQNEYTGQILDDCHNMREIAIDFSKEGSEVENSGKELKNLSSRLDDTVRKFNV